MIARAPSLAVRVPGDKSISHRAPISRRARRWAFAHQKHPAVGRRALDGRRPAGVRRRRTGPRGRHARRRAQPGRVDRAARDAGLWKQRHDRAPHGRCAERLSVCEPPRRRRQSEPPADGSCRAPAAGDGSTVHLRFGRAPADGRDGAPSDRSTSRARRRARR
jgi:hypothetical protein